MQALILMQPTLVPTLPKLIDEYGELLRQKAEVEVRVTKEIGFNSVRLEQIEAEFKLQYLKHPPEQPAVSEGQRYYLKVTPCEYRRELVIKAKRKLFAALKKKLGADPLGLFSITQEAVKSSLGTGAIEEYYTKERVGPRKFEVISKNPPASAVVQDKAA